MVMPERIASILVLVIAGCGADVPAMPTYFADVHPILRANCVRCHGSEPSDPKTAKFRLDRYVKGDAATFDVWDYAQTSGDGSSPMVRVAVDHEAPAMPPDYPLTDRQRDILARWVEQGATKGTRSNRAPNAVLVSPSNITAADQSLDLTVRAWDDDLDGLVVQLWARDLTLGPDRDLPISALVGSGQRTISIDTGALASKHVFEIYAAIDDGFFDDPAQNLTVATQIPQLAVDHGARGTAPTVKLVTPNGGETVIGTIGLEWTATDPDAGDTLTIDLALVSVAADGTESVVAAIGSGIPNTGSFSWAIPSSIPTAGANGAIPYHVRVTATDTLGMPRNTRSDRSDAPVTIARSMTTTLTWDDVKPIFVAYCIECHGQPAKTMALESFRLDKYDAADPEPPANSDLGVFEMKGTVYQRAITTQNMPPASAREPSAAERDMIGNWILGGAPRGGGPVDQRPTFTWVLPSTTQTSSPMVTLQWTAADAVGLASGSLEYARVNGAPASGCTSTVNPVWMPITQPEASAVLMGATSWANSFAWPVPSTPNGYFCVRGSVRDTANQLTVVVNPFGIK
jgi:mono/diheme cytochrome c family protein